MAYKNAKDILPPELLREVQRYADGELLYIPATDFAAWGERCGTRDEYRRRNDEIRRLHSALTVDQLARRFCLSEDSIRKIIRA